MEIEKFECLATTENGKWLFTLTYSGEYLTNIALSEEFRVPLHSFSGIGNYIPLYKSKMDQVQSEYPNIIKFTNITSRENGDHIGTDKPNDS